eukprot:6127213-Alexandrium_andersonii.AAC.1
MPPPLDGSVHPSCADAACMLMTSSRADWSPGAFRKTAKLENIPCSSSPTNSVATESVFRLCSRADHAHVAQ